MCFTVNVNLIREELENRYGSTFLDPDKYRPSYYYHAFGLPELPAICSDNTSAIRLLKWGLIPAWVRDSESADEIRYKTFNARSETIDSKSSFASSFASKRCIVPVRGFFEWQHQGGSKIPWYICRNDGDIMSLAGIWSEWTESNTGDVLATFSIITTGANELMEGIHNSKKRMPVVLERTDVEKWLDLNAKKDELISLLKPYKSEILKAHTISDLVNQKYTDRNTPEVIRPYIRDRENTLF